MAEYLRLARLYFLLLALVTIGRWSLSLRGYPYEKGTDKFSIVILTMFAAIFYGAFCRRWRGFGVLQAALMAGLIALSSQLVITISMVVSYAAGLETYFNNPIALNVAARVDLATALAIRARGLLFNTVFSMITGMLGWALGALLPADRK